MLTNYMFSMREITSWKCQFHVPDVFSLLSKVFLQKRCALFGYFKNDYQISTFAQDARYQAKQSVLS